MQKGNAMRSFRLLMLVLTTLLALTLLASCDQGTTPSDADTTAAPATEAPTEDVTEAPTSETPEETTADTAADETPEETTETPTEEETTEPFVLPTADPAEASAAGLPLDGNSYTVGGEDPANDPAGQYDYLSAYPHAYEGKTFTLYGNILENAGGYLVISLGDEREIVVYFPSANEPTVGSYVKITATYEKTVDMGEYADFNCFTMMVSACEVLGEAKGPNGGRLMYITASTLNVRTSSDTSSNANIIGTYSKGDLVEVFEQDAKGWYRVSYNGQTAYISNKYVSETKP